MILRRVGSFFTGLLFGAAPILKTAWPPAGKACVPPKVDPGAAAAGAGAWAGFCPNWNAALSVPPAAGKPLAEVAGDAGWLPKAGKGFDGAVADVGVGPPKENAFAEGAPKPVGPGEAGAAGGWPKPPVPPPDVDRLKANGAAVGAAADGCPKPPDPPKGAGETDGAGASAGFASSFAGSSVVASAAGAGVS